MATQRSISPLARALGEAIETSGRSAKDIAETLDIPATTLRAKLNGQSSMEPLRKSDQDLVRSVCSVIRVDPEVIFREAEEIALSAPAVDENLLDLFLAVLQDPKSSPGHRETASNQIKQLFRQKLAF